jgi:hypothetical protein
MTRSRSAARDGTKIAWSKIGRRVLREYKNGESPLTLSRAFKIPKGAIAAFLGRQGVRRSKKEAKRVEKEQERKRVHAPRNCKLCSDPFVPTSPNQKYCKTCIPDKQAHGRFTSKGISQRHWDAIITSQDGTCALCNEKPTDVDHDHQTRAIRGALCGGCNQALSHIEQPGWADRATQYLTRDTGHRVPEAAHRRQVAWHQRLKQRRKHKHL